MILIKLTLALVCWILHGINSLELHENTEPMITYQKNFKANEVCRKKATKLRIDHGFFFKEFADFGEMFYVLYIPLFHIMQNRVQWIKRAIGKKSPELFEMKSANMIIPGLVFRILIIYLIFQLCYLQKYLLNEAIGEHSYKTQGEEKAGHETESSESAEHVRELFVKLFKNTTGSLFWAFLIAGGPYDYLVAISYRFY